MRSRWLTIRHGYERTSTALRRWSSTNCSCRLGGASLTEPAWIRGTTYSVRCRQLPLLALVHIAAERNQSFATANQPAVDAAVPLPAAAATAGGVAPAVDPATGAALAAVAPGLPDAAPPIGTSTGGAAATVGGPTGNTALT